MRRNASHFYLHVVPAYVYAESERSIWRFSCSLGEKPTRRFTSRPPWKTTRVGILKMPNCTAVFSLSSVFIFAKRTLPSYSVLSSSTMGLTMRQGPHQGAQK